MPEASTFRVKDIKAGEVDFAGIPIDCVYLYNPPDYAVYRTPARVTVQFADDKTRARGQRQQLTCLTPLRGQINGLIDGWHDKAPPEGSGGLFARVRHKTKLHRRAIRYDRRVADALVTGLQGDGATALALLAEVKNDIISERTSMARTYYMWFALALVAAIIVLMTLLSSEMARPYSPFAPEMVAVWTAVSGGTLGAFFSIAIGLKGRTVLIDLQNADNAADAILRILIGAISGGMMLCLLRSGLVSSLLKEDTLDPSKGDYSYLLVFVIGFVAGFFERLVPDVLSQTNLGTAEHPIQGTAAGGTPTPPPAPSSARPAPAPAEELDSPPADDEDAPAPEAEAAESLPPGEEAEASPPAADEDQPQSPPPGP